VGSVDSKKLGAAPVPVRCVETVLNGRNQSSLRLRIIVAAASAYFSPVNRPHFITVDIHVHIFVAHHCGAMGNHDRPILRHGHPHTLPSR
jgi:hypothetical protein